MLRLVFAFLLWFQSLSFSYEINFSCFQRAGELYQINPYLLYTIAKVESGLNPGAIGRNKNGTIDIGLMQINSSWIPILRKYGINGYSLFDPCQNILVGAWILRQCIYAYGETWQAIDCYNKGKKAKHNSQYVWKIYKKYFELVFDSQ